MSKPVSRRRRLSKLWPKLLLAAVAMTAPRAAFAWGQEGHKIVADIAEKQLSPRAMRAVGDLLALDNASHLADIAAWADTVKVNRPGMPSHSIRPPLAGGPIRADECPTHFCVVAAITFYTNVLGNPRAPRDKREEALKYVVHLIGDVHQPLHCVAATGSGLPVVFEGRPTNLHHVWDNDIIASQGGTPGQIAHDLLSRNPVGHTGGGPLEWAQESGAIARDFVYRDIPPHSRTPITLPTDYAARAWPVVSSQLLLAGDRLANVLNRVLG